MRPKLALKTLLRSPARTVLIFILLAAVTFALFSQVMEYSITSREMKKAVSLYNGVTAVESSPAPEEAKDMSTPLIMFSDERVNAEVLPEHWRNIYENLSYDHLTQEQTDKIDSLPYVTYTDTRYMTAGYSDTYYRVDDGIEFYEYTNQCVVEGTVEVVQTDKLAVGDLELLAGVPRRAFGDNSIYVVAEQDDATHLGMTAERDGVSEDMAIYYNGGGDVPRITNFVTVNSKYGIDWLSEIEAGKRYVFVLRYEDYSNNLASPLKYYLTDPFVDEYCDAVYCVDGEPENYLEKEEYAGLKAYIDSVNARRCTFDVVYTENTGSIRYFSDRTIGISEGRGITPEDTKHGRNVCVIHHDMAMEHGLSVGDTFTLKLGDKLFEQYMAKGAISVSPETEAENLTEVQLEIVGIFKDTRKDEIMSDDPFWSYSANTVFVPKHLLNADTAGHTFAPGEVSFVVENAWDIPAFVQECIPEIEAMGLTVFFSDSGWTDMLENYKETEKLSLIKIAVLTAAVAISTGFAAYLYIVGKRREYAIMRVLGTDKKKSGRALLIPLSVLSVCAVAAGSAAAYIYTVFNVRNNETIKAIASQGAVDASISGSLTAACISGEILLIMIMAFIMLAKIGSNSPLALIQQGAQKVKRIKAGKKAPAAEPAEPVVLGQWVSIPALERDGNDRSFKFVSRYVLRHIRRSAAKAVLFVLVSVMLLSVLGQLNIMDQAYMEIFNSTEVMSNFAGYLNFNYVTKLLDSGYVTDVYYQNRSETTAEGVDTEVYLTSDIERLTGEIPEITYAKGYDGEVLHKVGNTLIMGKGLLEELGLELGDTVRLSDNGVLSRIEDKFMNKYIMANGTPDGIKKDQLAAWKREILDQHRDEIDKTFDEKADKFIIAGVVETPSGDYDRAVFTAGSKYMSNQYGILVILDIIEAKLENNKKADRYRKFGTELAAANLTGEVAFVMDDSKLGNVKTNVELMDTLYPIVMTAVLAIGAFICGLVIVQSSKEICIMRILGTSKKKTWALLVSEQMVLCVTAVLLALVVLIIRRVSAGVYLQMMLAFAIYIIGIFAASMITAYVMTKKNALDMLHTKE